MGKTLIFWAKAALIALAGWWVMAPALHGPWIWDDDLYITRNPLLHSAGGLARIWFAAPGVNYFPLTFTVQWLEWQAWGTDTAGYHAVNIALHLLSAFLLWRILFRLGARQSWIGGLLFAIHPLAVESVAWISELKNCLSLPFVLLAFLTYTRYDKFLQEGREDSARERILVGGWSGLSRDAYDADRATVRTSASGTSRSTALGESARAPLYYSASLLLFVLAMLSKSTVVMFPFVLLLYAWWKRGTLKKSDAAAAAPFFAVSLALGLVTVWFEHHRAMGGLDTAAPGGFLSRVGLAGLALWFYLAQACDLWSAHSLIYPPPGFNPHWLSEMAAWILIAGIVAWVSKRRGRHAALGLGWFALNLAPLLGVLPIAYAHISWVADQFAYAALPGIVGLAAAGLGWGLMPSASGAQGGGATGPSGAFRAQPSYGAKSVRGTVRSTLKLSIRQIVGVLLVTGFAVWFAVDAHAYADTFADGETLWRHAVALAPESAEAHSNLGLILAQRHRPPEAIAEFEKALQLKPGYPEVEGNLGLALLQAQRVPEGVDHLERAARLAPNSAEARYHMGLGLLLELRMDEAVAAEREAVRLDPQSPECHYGLGLALQMTDVTGKAAAEYEQALRLDPDFAPARAALVRLQRAQ